MNMLLKLTFYAKLCYIEKFENRQIESVYFYKR